MTFNKNKEIFNNFINYYQSLNSNEKFLLSKEFNKLTGGTLSEYNPPNTVAVAIVPIYKNNKIGLLGLKRNIEPALGRVAFPGGFVEANEDFLSGAIRELKEETGLSGNDIEDPTNWSFYSNTITPRNENLVFYKFKKILDWDLVSENLKNATTLNETQSLEFIDENITLGFPLHDNQAKSVLLELESLNQHKSTKKTFKP